MRDYYPDDFPDSYDDDEEDVPFEDRTFDPEANYSKGDLEEWANHFLRKDADRELCRICFEADEASIPYGDETGEIKRILQFDKQDRPLLDDEGRQLALDYPELVCESGHKWYKGEGKRRDIRGSNPILFESHLKNRMKREIYNNQGFPDPGIVSGIYNRVHPQGRKVNTDEQRKKHGASFYR